MLCTWEIQVLLTVGKLNKLLMVVQHKKWSVLQEGRTHLQAGQDSLQSSTDLSLKMKLNSVLTKMFRMRRMKMMEMI